MDALSEWIALQIVNPNLTEEDLTKRVNFAVILLTAIADTHRGLGLFGRPHGMADVNTLLDKLFINEKAKVLNASSSMKLKKGTKIDDIFTEFLSKAPSNKVKL